jgi:hypothetical protein
MKILFITSLLILAALAPTQAQTSSQGSGSIAAPAPTAAAPVWGKLVVNGNVVTCYYATGTAMPTTWIPLGAPQTIGFINDPILVGIFITAHGSGLSTGTIDNFSITPTPTYRLADGDVGSPPLMGSANLISGVWTLTGSGSDIWGTSDHFNFQPWLVWGDCTVICRVTSISKSGSAWQKIGLMVRDGFNSGSDYALFCASDGAGMAFQYRLQFQNNPDMIEYVSPPAPGVTSSNSVGYGLTGSTTYTLRP